jgi:hypothetical protein
MLRKNNRGAGLVTVVVVLAVCGILLAGVLGFAFQHYKNVLLSSAGENENAEIELCARLLLEQLNSGKGLDESGSVFNTFYGAETTSNDKTGVILINGDTCTVHLSSGDLLQLVCSIEDDLLKYVISYRSGEETVSSCSYYFANEGDVYTFAEAPAASEETEGVLS